MLLPPLIFFIRRLKIFLELSEVRRSRSKISSANGTKEGQEEAKEDPKIIYPACIGAADA